jgi:hypothetical protein
VFSGSQISRCGRIWGKIFPTDIDSKEFRNNLQGFRGVEKYIGGVGGCRKNREQGTGIRDQKCTASLLVAHALIVHQKRLIVCKRDEGFG